MESDPNKCKFHLHTVLTKKKETQNIANIHKCCKYSNLNLRNQVKTEDAVPLTDELGMEQ